MDSDWVIQQLNSFIGLTELYRPSDPPGVAIIGDTRRPHAGNDAIIAAAEVVEPILDRVLPRWREDLPEDASGRWQQHREAAIRAKTRLERQEELAQRLGENAPTINAAQLHPWVWAGAKSLWQSGHYREAVRAASVMVNAETQNKMGRRDVSETDLFNQAFGGTATETGKLRLPDDDGGKTAESFRRGVRAFAEGCFAAIRNPTSHDPQEELDEHEALEQLAALSVLARWVDDATLVT
jgi:uncharacterized protein (TIGR02391 family)